MNQTLVQNLHRTLVSNLAKKGEDILSTLTPPKAHILHMAVGVSGEAGELLDCIKKWTIYNKELDLENLVEELGDIEFFLEGLRSTFSITREDCLMANIKKLEKRYNSQTYSDSAAQARADKA